MKHRIAATICLIIAMFSLAFSTFSIGVREGIRRVIEESRMYLNGTYIELHYDGNVYVHNIE